MPPCVECLGRMSTSPTPSQPAQPRLEESTRSRSDHPVAQDPTLPPLHDTHCHLDSSRYEERVEDILARAWRVGVRRVTTIGCATGVDDVGQSVEVATALEKQHPGGVTATVGVHPHDASHWNDALASAVEHHARAPIVVAIGETGLDYFYEHSPVALQQDAFRREIAIARTVGKPLIIHTRNAAKDTLRILQEEQARDIGGIIHCFSEDWAFARQALDMGFFCAFSGIVTFKRSEDIQEAAKHMPSDRLLIETDAPYLAPVPLRGKKNEPAFVAHTAAFLATLRNVSLETLAYETFDNAARVFGLPRN